jgi:hypothetical protein
VTAEAAVRLAPEARQVPVRLLAPVETREPEARPVMEVRPATAVRAVAVVTLAPVGEGARAVLEAMVEPVEPAPRTGGTS